MPKVLDVALCTHPGMVRDSNEDAIGADAELGLAVLADGLGGYNAGEVASAVAVSRLLTDLKAVAATAVDSDDPGALLSACLHQANAAVLAAAGEDSRHAGMASTVVVAWLARGRLWIGHVGDSRAYRFRSGALTPLTKDHSYLQELIDAGVVAEAERGLMPQKNLVTRALGAGAAVDAEVHAHSFDADDWVLLCSDGLPEMVSDREIAEELAATLPDARRAAVRLVDRANAAGGNDNISVILLRLPPGQTG